MAIEIQAPNSFSKYLTHNYITIFAGGSIEMNRAKPWQRRLVTAFKDYDDVVILNPRRNSCDSSWKQVAKNKQFRKQVQWELDGLESCDTSVMYFDPDTKSPISLLELGLFGANTNFRTNTLPKMHVICPKGFWRRGNVEIVCLRYSIPYCTSLTAAANSIKEDLEHYRRQPSQVNRGLLR